MYNMDDINKEHCQHCDPDCWYNLPAREQIRIRYHEARYAAEMQKPLLRRLSIPELIYLIQDIQEDEFYGGGKIGRYYLQWMYNNVMAEFKRRAEMELTPGTIPHTNVIQAIKERADIVNVLEQYTEVYTHAGKWTYTCSLHGEDKHASGVIYKATNSAYCFVCHKGGDVIKMVELFGKTDTRGAIRKLCQMYGISPDILSTQEFDPKKQAYMDALTVIEVTPVTPPLQSETIDSPF